MTYDRRKSLNRLSALLLPSNPSKSSSPTSASPIGKLTKFGRRDTSNGSSSSAWPLPNDSIPEIPQGEVLPPAQRLSAGENAAQNPGPSAPIIGQAVEAYDTHPQRESSLTVPNQINEKVPAQPSSPVSRQRSSSASYHATPYQPETQQMPPPPRHSSTAPDSSEKIKKLRGRKSENSLRKSKADLPPRDSSRSVSTSMLSKLPSANLSNGTGSDDKGRRKSFFFGGKAGRTPSPQQTHRPAAWTLGPGSKEYDAWLLSRGEKDPELWDENGDVLIHLFPPGASHGASFRISAQVLSSSPKLISLVHGQVYSSRHSRQSRRSTSASDRGRSGSRTGSLYVDSRSQQVQISVPGTPSIGPSPSQSHSDGTDDSAESRGLVEFRLRTTEIHLILNALSGPGAAGKATREDLDVLVAARNLFAFLCGKSLVATQKFPTAVRVFHNISQLLREYEFSNLDGNTFGEVAEANFSHYVEQYNLADVRFSREKTVEAVWLSLDMRNAALWKEAFSHCAGKLDAIKTLKEPRYEYTAAFPGVVRNRLDKAHMELENRMTRIKEEFTNFDFPYVFSQVMNSRVADEAKIVRFEQWKSAFNATRRFMLAYCKSKFGAWPPKPKGKRGEEAMGGLNRRVLQDLYDDLTILYDLVVDRKHLTSRITSLEHPDRRIEILRKVLNEYDNSGSPIYPAVPFDAPLLPRTRNPSRDDGSDSDSKDANKKIPKVQLVPILRASYNEDTLNAQGKHRIVETFLAHEVRTAAGMTSRQLTNYRLGTWLFLYSLIQALPYVTVDAPDLQFTEGVEYFLCMPSRGRLPWSNEREQNQLFRNPANGAIIHATKDNVNFSVEGIYKRSHCWRVGLEWEYALAPAAMPITNSVASDDIPQFATLDAQLHDPSAPPSQYGRSDSGTLSEYHTSQSTPPPGHKLPPISSLGDYNQRPLSFERSQLVQSPEMMFSDSFNLGPQLAASQPQHATYPPPQTPVIMEEPHFGVVPPPHPFAHELPNDQPIPVELPSTGLFGSTRSSSPSLAPFRHTHFSASTPNLSQLDPPAAVPRPRNLGGAARRANRQSMIPNLEMLPAPAPPMNMNPSRSGSGSMTFDQIFGTSAAPVVKARR